MAHVELLVKGGSLQPWDVDAFNVADPGQIFYVASSIYIIFLMMNIYARTREREKAWKFGLYALLGAIVVTPFWYLVFKQWVPGHKAIHPHRALEVCSSLHRHMPE
jgi:hypothetical protein